jgi:hypothetical protein
MSFLWAVLDGADHEAIARTLEFVIQSSSDGDSTLAIVAGFFISLYLVYDGFGKWKTKRLMEDTPTEKVRSMAAGRTELEGVAHSDGETIEAPFSDEACLHIDWEVEEYRKDPDDDDYDWETVAQGSQSVPFYLDDGTGRVVVRAASGDATFEISDANTRQITVGGGQRPPAEVAEFIERHDSQHEQASLTENPIDALGDFVASENIGHSNRKRRYSQEILPDGNDIYLLGSAVPREADGEMAGQEDLLELTREEDLDTFLVSDRSEEELESYYEKWGPLEIVGGIGLSAICLALLLGAF